MRLEIEVISEITDIETIAVGRSIRELKRLQRMYGEGRWRKLKGIATVRLPETQSLLLKFISMRRMASAGKISRLSVFSKSEP